MWKNLTIPIMLGLLICFSLPVLAKDIQVDAFLNESVVKVGQEVTLTVQIQGESSVEAPEVDVPNCDVYYYGPSTQISIVNGKHSEMVSHLYSLTPLKAGAITIPAIPVKIGGKTYMTNPIELGVRDNSTGGTNNSAGSNSNDTANSSGGNQVFLELEVPRTRLYLNEEIPLTVNLYIRQDVKLKEINYPKLDIKGFLIEPFAEPEQVMEQINGEYYYVLPFKTTIQPLAKGQYTIGPVELSVDALVPRRRSYNSFFDSGYEVIPVNLTARGINVQVPDFPTAGKPADFNGAVGSFYLNVDVTPETANLNEPVTVRATISGTGSFKTVTAPVLEKVQGFKYYEPQVVSGGNQPNSSQSHQEKVFEQVIIPGGGAETMPALSFSYFDPADEQYHTLTYGPLPLQITGDKTVGQGVADYRNNKSADQVLGQDILYIKASPGSLKSAARWPIFSPGFLAYNGSVFTVFLLGFLLYVKQNQETPAMRRRKEAIAKTTQLLKESEKFLKERQHSAFYDTVYQAVQNYLKEYFDIAITGISDYESERLLKAGLKFEILEEIKTFYREIDEKRFAGAFSTEAEMEKILNRAREIVGKIGKGEVA